MSPVRSGKNMRLVVDAIAAGMAVDIPDRGLDIRHGIHLGIERVGHALELVLLDRDSSGQDSHRETRAALASHHWLAVVEGGVGGRKRQMDCQTFRWTLDKSTKTVDPDVPGSEQVSPRSFRAATPPSDV